MKHFRFAALAVIALAGSAQAQVSTEERAQGELAKALAGRVPGKAADCINLRDIRSTEIIDRTAILYRVSADKVYVNYPTSGAYFLDSDDILLSQTFSSQLCSIDVVRLLDRSSQFPIGSVGLGKFVPYVKAPASPAN